MSHLWCCYSLLAVTVLTSIFVLSIILRISGFCIYFNHKKPVYTHYYEHNDRCNAHFLLEDCESCPYRQQCNPSFRKTYALREVSWKAVNRAKQLRYMKTEEFKELAHFQNGVESIPSLLCREYQVDKIPAHGKKQTRFHFGFKIAALNLQKLLDYTNSLDKCALKNEVA